MKEFDVTKDYNREDFVEFLTDFLPEDFEQEEEQAYFDYINIEEGYKLGTCDSLDLDVFEFRTKAERKRDPRVTLTREAVSFMRKYNTNQNALVIFYSTESHNWRFSLITTDYEIVKNKVKPLYSNPRRFSFRLGGECKAHTPKVMLFKKGQICEHTENGKTVTPIEDLKNRFALEVVSKQFFDEYKVFYEDFVQYITGNRYVKSGGKGKYERKAVNKENTKIFSQFKKLANDDYELACKYVRDYIKKFMGRLVFLQFLQKKGWLGVDENNSWGNGNKNFLLDLFKSSNNKDDFLEKDLEPLFFGMLNTDVNDRKKLFKEKNWDTNLLNIFKQIPYLNGGLFEDDNLDKIEIKFPQEMFSNPTKADKERTFNDKKDYSKEPYPFTESCGLLDFFARYNFTIDETDPADMEIGVEPEMLGKIFENLLEDNKDKGAFYTPKEIVQYMCRESLIAYLGDNEKVRSLVTTHIADFNDSEKTELIKKLKAVKVCDPAVGSGAFPMGILNELFACRVALGENEEAAEIKKQIVRENIYGVDIEKGAVDIARLRFWLAIIVDEKEPFPLPNLDYKIMQGNSLLESYKGIDLSNLCAPDKSSLFDDSDDIKTLLSYLQTYFDKHQEKIIIRNAIQASVMDLLKKRGISGKEYDELESIDMHSNSNFFLWHTWFSDVFNRPNDCNGFDIVIGNPPYFVITSEVHFKKEYEKQWEHLKSGRMNIYQIFFGLAGMISNSKGIVSFIHPKTLLSDSYLSSTRNYLCKTFNDITILNIVNRHDVFENVLQAVIVSIWQKKKIKHCRVAENQSKKDLSDTKYIEPSWGQFIDSDNKFIVSGNKSIYTILEKVSRLKTERFHFKTGNYEWNKLKQNLSANITKDSIRLIYGENIQRFWFSQSKKRINTTYINGTNVTIIDKPTIMTQRTTSSEQDWRIFATLINPKDFNYSLTSENSTNVFECNDLTIGKYYLGILNSRFMDFYFRIFNSNTHVSSGELNALPIPISTTSKKNAIIELVDKILELKRINNLADISSLELQIDEIVYDLFDLTEEEKSIIRV